MFAPLRQALERLPADRWPTHAELSALAHGVRFVPPRPHTARERLYYELHIAETGEVETRAENWHDLFNALVWITFPRAKAAINAQHAAILRERGEAEARHRSPERDALTLFDEGGIVVVSDDASLTRLIRDFEWKPLFWERRAEVLAKMRFLVFGHGCYEQAMNPYIGMVAKTITVPPGDADTSLAQFFSDRANFPSPKALPPMPVLGVPGWHSPQDEAFYGDRRHFRSRPRR